MSTGQQGSFARTFETYGTGRRFDSVREATQSHARACKMYALPHAGGVVKQHQDSRFEGPPRVDLRSDTVTLPTPAVRVNITWWRISASPASWAWKGAQFES